MTLDDETAERIAADTIATRIPYSVPEPVALVKAGYAARDAEVEELRAWKAQALEVLGGWERVWEATGMPGELGEQKSECVRREVEELRAEVQRAEDQANNLAGDLAQAERERDAALAEVEELRAELRTARRQRDEERSAKEGNIRWLNKRVAERDAAQATLAKLREWAEVSDRPHIESWDLGYEHATIDVLEILDESPTERETPADETSIQADADSLAAEIHEAWEFQYDQCDHGLYMGGHLHGEPYAMCRLSAERIVRRRLAKTHGEVVPDDRA